KRRKAVLVRLLDRWPELLDEFAVAAALHIASDRIEIHWRSVGVVVSEIVFSEPIHQVNTLRHLVHHLAIFALASSEKAQRVGGACKVSEFFHGPRRHHGVASEPPVKSGALAFAGRAVAGN